MPDHARAEFPDHRLLNLAMTHRTIGIDLAIRGDHVAQIFDDGRPLGPPLRFRHDPASLDAFVARVAAGLGDTDSVQAVMEPTGMSWFPVAHRLADASVEVARVKGKRVKALRRYLSEHAKTDLADAQVLAAMPGFGGPRLDPVHIPAARSHALQRLTKQRGRFQDRIAASKRRLIDLVRWASPALERVLPDLRTRLALALLRRWLDPDAVLAARKSVIARFVARHASGNHPHSGAFVDALVDGLRHAAREARALHRTHVDFAELQAEVAIEVDAMLADIEAVTVLQRRIDALYAELQPDDVLRSIPGSASTSPRSCSASSIPPIASAPNGTSADSAASFPAAPTAAAQSGPARGSHRPATTGSSAPSCSPPILPARSILTSPRSIGA